MRDDDDRPRKAVALTDYQPSDDCGVNAQSHRGIGAETLTQEPRYPVLFRLIYVPRADHAHLDPALGVQALLPLHEDVLRMRPHQRRDGPF